MPKFKIFYSWQSDLPGNKTRSFIRECIDDAIAFAEESEAIEAVRDEATKDTTGSPNIVNTLFSKIDECDLFVADISLCFTGDVKKEESGQEIIKHSPNPNVLIELGYAVKTLGWERVICLCNTDYGSDYPFDIAQNRRTPYSLIGKTRADVRRNVAKIIFSNILMLRGQPPRARAGEATHIIGTYDFEQRKVIGSLRALDIGKSESYELHNLELIEESKKLATEIQSLSEKILTPNAEEDKQKGSATESPHLASLSFDKSQNDKDIIHALAESYKASEVLVVWQNIEEDRERIKRWLDLDVDDTFFNLGGLKKVEHLLNLNGPTLNGTDEEKTKYDRIEDLSYKLLLLDVRTQYLKTFDGMCFIPLAIQNVSSIADSDIRIVVKVDSGEAIEPDTHLILDEFEGLQGELCKNDVDDDIGIIAELFILPEDSVIHTEVEEWCPVITTKPTIPIFNGHGFQQPNKTEEDYKAELEEFIASPKGRDFYEFEVKRLRPGECRWIGKGILLKPDNGQVSICYSVRVG